MKTSRSGIELIKRFEGCRLKAYQDSVGVWTIGYGLTTAAGLMTVRKGLTITQDEADDLLSRSLVKYEAAVSKALKRSPNQNQFDAMTSICFNIGPGAFAGSSIVRNFNAGNLLAAANSFTLWNKAGGKVLPGLVMRRDAERTLFLKPSQMPVQPASPVPAPAVPKPAETPPVITPVAAKPSWWARFARWVK